MLFCSKKGGTTPRADEGRVGALRREIEEGGGYEIEEFVVNEEEKIREYYFISRTNENSFVIHGDCFCY